MMVQKGLFLLSMITVSCLPISVAMAENEITQLSSGGSVSTQIGNAADIGLIPTSGESASVTTYGDDSYVNFTLTDHASGSTCAFTLKGADLSYATSQSSYCCPSFEPFKIGLLQTSSGSEGVYINDDGYSGFASSSDGAGYRQFIDTCPGT